MFGLSILVVLVVYAYLAKVAVTFAENRAKSKFARYATIAVFVLIPTWDIIPGHLYFNYLCGKEAGTSVLKTVEVEKEYFLSDGRPDDKRLSDRFVQPHEFDKGFLPLFHIARFESTIQDKQSGEILGRATSLSHYGGWLSAYLFPLGNATTCPERVHTAIWGEVIKPKKIVP
jgi:hypothetical protein